MPAPPMPPYCGVTNARHSRLERESHRAVRRANTDTLPDFPQIPDQAGDDMRFPVASDLKPAGLARMVVA